MISEETTREMLNPLSPSGKQALSNIVAKHHEANVLQTTEQAGDVLELLDSQFYEVLHSCEDSHLGLIRAYLEGKMLTDPSRRDINFINARNILGYFDKLSTVDDKRKCLEVTASLLFETSWSPSTEFEGQKEVLKPEVIEPRPPTSRPPSVLGSRRGSRMRSRSSLGEPEPSARLDVYETTYDRHFPRPLSALNITRPRSAFPTAAEELSDLRKHYTSTYSTQFYEKDQTRSAPIRSGSGSGYRRNNPHPSTSFMRFQLPRTHPLGFQMPITAEFDASLEQAIKGKTTSTYYNHYLGLPLGVNIKSAFNSELGSKPQSEPMKLERSNSCFETTTAKVFTNPNTPEDLKLQTLTRHGSNMVVLDVADKIIPTANKRLMVVPGRGKLTTYSREFVPLRLPRERPKKRPVLLHNQFNGVNKVPVELFEKPFVVNKSEIRNYVREMNNSNKDEK